VDSGAPSDRVWAQSGLSRTGTEVCSEEIEFRKVRATIFALVFANLHAIISAARRRAFLLNDGCPNICINSLDHFFLLFVLNSDVPDPFKLVRRIHALEIAARQLQEACLDIAEKRKKLSPAVIDQQEENNDVLNHVCIVW
jgi:hypothetical protein